MKEVFEVVDVHAGPGGAPLVVRWERRTLRTRSVIDAWRAGGEWWAGRFPRDYWLIDFAQIVAEVYREDRRALLPGFEAGGADLWVLARVVD
ncbi:hypothetical protein [Deinococcus yavapaiensis]|uniref:Uncharacterized protein n=1 Tax=Deinococcus yavapaiensis KR-236 TaxID=694435 RepID=A0A318SBX8_9DEIO|nr:hypothetical protein [Deinococcus yavapaiensis]PYE56321.1 hypothetical protein DES52_101125 [Deinococcus yavapaiensis KR-236]